MIPLLRSKRKYAKAGEADNVDETNYGAPIEETSFIQVKCFQFFLITIFKATITTTSAIGYWFVRDLCAIGHGRVL